MTGLVLNHLWQSTAFAACAWLLTLTLRSNGAQTRFWVWFAASIKFLIPFAALIEIGRYLPTSATPKISAHLLFLAQPAAQPFSTSILQIASPVTSATSHFDVISLALLFWGLGFCFLMARWGRRQLRLRRLLRDAIDLPIHAPVKVKSASSPLEPGLVGIWRPVILLPHGIVEHLSADELDAIMAHELCHMRRHDNLLAGIHMFVEALFWFHPLVWWLGRRMIEERERACDESVLASGKAPKIYADSILKVCKLYLHSPLTCAAGVSGADLKQRLEEIVENKIVHRLKNGKKALLAAAAMLVIGVPVALGQAQEPQSQAQTQTKTSNFLMMLQNVPEPDGALYRGPAPNRVHLTFTHDENGSPLAIILSADRCTKDEKDPVHCQGNIALSMPSGIVTGDTAMFDNETRKFTLNGKVVMFAGMNRMNGALLTLDANTGVIHMNGKDIKSGFPGLQPPPGKKVNSHDEVLPDK